MAYDSCSCDYDPPSVHRTNFVKAARKEHHCYECGSAIAVGEPYENTWGVWDGNVSTFKTCHLCAELRQWAQISVPCFCWVYGDLHENVRDLVSEAREDCPVGFTMEWGRRMIKIQRRKYVAHWPRQWRRRQKRGTFAIKVAPEARP